MNSILRYNKNNIKDSLSVFFENCCKNGRRQMAKQPEQILENKLVDQLQTLGYSFVNIKNEEELIANLKKQLETHNKTEFSEFEFKRILNELKKGSVSELLTS
ncbi:MAG: hypothetical protein U9Q83_05845 [Bacteroidota bacterium]|nr:hypothetical protein [Bacteroidota bacterium]